MTPGWQWRLALMVWFMSGVAGILNRVFADGEYQPHVGGFTALDIQWLLLMAGIGLAWGDLRRQVMEHKERIERLEQHQWETEEDK